MVEQAFVCGTCRYRSAAPGDCPKACGPLFDLRNDDVRAALIEDDDRRVEAHKTQNHWVGVSVGVVEVGFSLWWAPLREAILEVPLPVPFGNPIKFILVGVMAAGVVAFGLDRWRPSPRLFPELRR